MNKDPVPMPSAEEKKQAISSVLELGLSKREGFLALLKHCADMGVGMLFFGLSDCLFLAAILGLMCLVPAALAAVEQSPITPLLFLLSPALYALLQLLTRLKEDDAGISEWKNSCAISPRVVDALRMLYFGAASTLLCVPQCAILWLASGRRFDFLWMLALAFSSLFLYAALSLSLHKRLFIPPLLWLLAGVALLCWKRSSDFLLTVPPTVFLLTALLAALLTLYKLKIILSKPTEGGTCYAVR